MSFQEADIGQVASSEPFDAVVGRLILEYLADPGAAVRSLSALLRPGGVMALQDAYWSPWLQLTEHLPLQRRCVSLAYEVFKRSGAHMDMGLVFYRTLQEAGLPAPRMRIEVPVGDDPNTVRWTHDLFVTLLPRMRQDELAASGIGDLDTLKSRLEAERIASNAFGVCPGLVGAWTRKPVQSVS